MNCLFPTRMRTKGSTRTCSATNPKCKEHLVRTSRMDDTYHFFRAETTRLQKPISNLPRDFHITDTNFKKGIIACDPIGFWSMLKTGFKHSTLLLPARPKPRASLWTKKTWLFLYLAHPAFYKEEVSVTQRVINTQGSFHMESIFNLYTEYYGWRQSPWSGGKRWVNGAKGSSGRREGSHRGQRVALGGRCSFPNSALARNSIEWTQRSENGGCLCFRWWWRWLCVCVCIFKENFSTGLMSLMDDLYILYFSLITIPFPHSPSLFLWNVFI